MVKLAFIVPLTALVELVESVATECIRKEPLFSDANISLSIHVAKNFRSIPPQALNADVIIARGLIIAELKRIHPDLTVVEVPIGAEMPATIIKAVEEHGKLPIAVIGSYNMVYASHGIGEAFGLDIKQYVQERNEDENLRYDMGIILRDGRKIIICGPVTYEFARTQNCYPYVLGMSQNSIRDALVRARHEAAVRRREREKAEQLQTLLDCAQEGVIAIDSHDRVTAINAVATSILNISPAKILGNDIYALLPLGKGHDRFATEENVDLRVETNGGSLSLRKRAVNLGDRQVGHIFTILKQEPSKQNPL